MPNCADYALPVSTLMKTSGQLRDREFHTEAQQTTLIALAKARIWVLQSKDDYEEEEFCELVMRSYTEQEENGELLTLIKELY